MTDDGWGNAWPDTPKQEAWPSIITIPPNQTEPVVQGWDLGNGADKTILTKVTKTHAKFTELHKQGSNLVDDEGHLYFQCEGCEALFDPATKSFKTLHDFAHKQGWKIKWNTNGLGYKIYCVKCGDGV